MSKRGKIIVATISISVTGYEDNRKVTKTVNWKVLMMDEKDPDSLIERERQHILSICNGQPDPEVVLEYRAKVTKRETVTFDKFLASEARREEIQNIRNILKND